MKVEQAFFKIKGMAGVAKRRGNALVLSDGYGQSGHVVCFVCPVAREMKASNECCRMLWWDQQRVFTKSFETGFRLLPALVPSWRYEEANDSRRGEYTGCSCLRDVFLFLWFLFFHRNLVDGKLRRPRGTTVVGTYTQWDRELLWLFRVPRGFPIPGAIFVR